MRYGATRVTQEIGDGPSPPLPAGSKYLISDVVQISGLGSDTTGTVYALEMTFDNRVNVCLDGETNGTLQTRRAGAVHRLLGQRPMEARSGTNETPPSPAPTTFLGTPLSTFLSEEAAKGVSLDSCRRRLGRGRQPGPLTQATYRSWEIVRGSGIFAVVPEPSTLAMCLSAVAALGCGFWRCRGKVMFAVASVLAAGDTN